MRNAPFAWLALLITIAGCDAGAVAIVGPDGGGCVPTSCAVLGAECGPVGDGCGGVLDCGGCAGGEACGVAAANQCGALCTPLTCAALGAECGTQADGCGGTIACGECAGGETCGGGGANRCGTGTCTPTTCEALGADCGPVGDGCGGVLECGTCASGEACGVETPSVCGAIPCTPTTCAAMGAECGTIPDGCGGELTCPVCPSGEVCGVGGANRCGATGIDAGPAGDSGIPATCTGVTCSGHGRCVVGAGGAECLCDSEGGYIPRGLECVLACEGVDCGSSGSCEEHLGAPLCECGAAGSFVAGAECRTTEVGRTLGRGTLYAITRVATGDSGVIVAGEQAGNVYFARLDETTATVWERTGPPGRAQTVTTMPDGDVLVGGYADPGTGRGFEAWITRVSPEGTPRPGFPRTIAGWNQLRGLAGGGAVDAVLQRGGREFVWSRLDATGAPTGATIDVGWLDSNTSSALRRTRDGGAIVVGFTTDASARALLTRVTAGGAMAWQREQGSTVQTRGIGVAETAAGFVTVGTRYPGFLQDLVVTTTSESGVAATSLVHEIGGDATGMSDDGAIILGASLSFAPTTLTYQGGYVARIDDIGNVLWHGLYGQTVSGGGTAHISRLFGAVRTPSGASIVVGSRRASGEPEMLVIRIDDTGRAL